MKYLFVSILLICSCTVSVTAQIIFGKNRSKKKELTINYASPKEFEIAGIEVTGIEYLDKNAIISLSGLRVGDKVRVPGDKISRAIKNLWRQGIIGNVEINIEKIEDENIWLTVVLEERPRLTRYTIVGVNKTQQGEISDKIELVRGKVLSQSMIKNTELEIKKYLESKGFLNAKIRITQKTDTILHNSSNLLVSIERGKKVKIKNINFEGNTTVSASILRKKMKNTGTTLKFSLFTDMVKSIPKLLKPKSIYNFLTHNKSTTTEFRKYLSKHVNLNFFKDAKFIQTDYQEDKQMLISHYNSKGYRDASIIFDTTYAINNKHMNIDLKIYEGNKYYFKDINWIGNYVYTAEQLNKVLAIKKGDVYDLDLVNKKLTFNPNGLDISSLYLDDGYLFFNVNPVEVSVTADSINLEMRIFEGTQATIREVNISGNDKTYDHVILRQLTTRPGDKFSRANIIRTQRELSQLGYFDPAQINPVPIPDPINETVDINWHLVEQSNDQIQLSGGWGGAFGFIGTFGVTFNNFSVRNIFKFKELKRLPVGDGQSLSIQFQLNGKNFQSYSIGFVEPWLGGKKPNSFGISFNRSIQRSISTTNETLGWLKVTGFSVNLGRRVQWPDDYFIVSTGISYKQYDLFQYTSRSLGFSTGMSNAILFNTTISRQSIDAPNYPTRGSLVSLNVSFTPPYSVWRNLDYDAIEIAEKYKWLEYHKWNFDSKYYLSLVGKLVLVNRVHFGYLGAYDNNIGVGPFERFQLGGSGLNGQNFLLGTDVIGLRGYPDNSIVPLADQNGINGGTIFSKYIMELRYPISLEQAATIYGLTFIEGGNNTNSFSEFNPFYLKKSAGFGVRILMPAFGLLGIDWAYGFDKLDGASSNAGSQFHFSIGQQIR